MVIIFLCGRGHEQKFSFEADESDWTVIAFTAGLLNSSGHGAGNYASNAEHLYFECLHSIAKWVLFVLLLRTKRIHSLCR